MSHFSCNLLDKWNPWFDDFFLLMVKWENLFGQNKVTRSSCHIHMPWRSTAPFLTVVEDELQIIGQCTSSLWLRFTQFNLPWILLRAPALFLRHMQDVGPLTCIYQLFNPPRKGWKPNKFPGKIDSVLSRN